MRKPVTAQNNTITSESSNTILTPFAWLDDVYNRHLHPRDVTIFDLATIQRKRVMFKAGAIVLMATALVGGCSV